MVYRPLIPSLGLSKLGETYLKLKLEIHNKLGMNAVFVCHQGFTDILNCLPIIRQKAKQYAILHVVYETQVEPLLKYFCADIPNIKYHSMPPKSMIPPTVLETLKRIPNIHAAECIGTWDIFRQDKFKNVWGNHGTLDAFVRNFYTLYDIPFETRFNEFKFRRDKEAEEKRYQAFVQTYGTEYIMYHDDNDQIGDKIGQLKQQNPTIPFVNLNKLSESMFDCLKILEHTKAFYLIDSSWACLIYLLKRSPHFQLFPTQPIHIYCLRNYITDFSSYPECLFGYMFMDSENPATIHLEYETPEIKNPRIPTWYYWYTENQTVEHQRLYKQIQEMNMQPYPIFLDSAPNKRHLLDQIRKTTAEPFLFSGADVWIPDIRRFFFTFQTISRSPAIYTFSSEDPYALCCAYPNSEKEQRMPASIYSLIKIS